MTTVAFHTKENHQMLEYSHKTRQMPQVTLFNFILCYYLFITILGIMFFWWVFVPFNFSR